MYLSVPVVSMNVLIRRYHFSCRDQGIKCDGDGCYEVWVIEVRYCILA